MLLSMPLLCSHHHLRLRPAIRWQCASTVGTSRPRKNSSVTNGSNDGNGLQVYNSLSSSYRTLPPRPNTSPLGIAMYVCGPTVYDSAHLGHGRTYVSLDILRRVALNLHHGSGGGGVGDRTDSSDVSLITTRPLYVMNITDVDDKIIQRSTERRDNVNYGKESEAEADPLSLARYYEREFWQDMDALNVMRPDVICRVSEHVELTIVPYIQQIVDGGMAYVIPEGECIGGNVEDGAKVQQQSQQTMQGSVYFDVRAFESITNGKTKYGKLAPDVASTDFFSWESDENEGDDEGEPIRKKRDPRDFCLWKYRPRSSSPMYKTIEPPSASYSSPWGPGRPGWHVECSAMIDRLSRDFRSSHKFAVHAGGVDLKFPHHSNEIAQAEAYKKATETGNDGSGDDFEEWIPHWIHTGHLYVKGRKMSKSLKNFVTIREMLGVTNVKESSSVLTSDQNNAWLSPADDFRLWCLGLSGAYRGPATYSKDRMEEARVVREKWIRFLMVGQECLDRLSSLDNGIGDMANAKSSRLWGEDELEMFHTVTKCSMNCRKALLDDLDGASFVKELTRIAETGLAYVEKVTPGQSTQLSKNRPEEPLRFALDTLRGQLELVGFTQKSVNAGIFARDALPDDILGGLSPTNASLLDESVAFRAAVRSAALGVIRKKNDGFDASGKILSLCDEMRDDTFPKLGIQILDNKVVHDENKEGVHRGWTHCSPRSPSMGRKM
mmetsp:Transcript_8917/g.21645  ORF Transcript_8917/g.21645 Transcript_8917/m.21645 type:complete len:721 (+) Transcript_8917:62-2224(+)